MRKSKVNHNAVMAIATIDQVKINSLAEHIKLVRLFIEKRFKTDINDVDKIHRLYEHSGDVVMEQLVDGDYLIVTFRFCVKRLAALAKNLNNDLKETGYTLIQNINTISSIQIAIELMNYLCQKANENQEEEYKKEESKASQK